VVVAAAAAVAVWKNFRRVVSFSALSLSEEERDVVEYLMAFEVASGVNAIAELHVKAKSRNAFRLSTTMVKKEILETFFMLLLYVM